MKDLPLSTCECEFVELGIEKHLRLDGRGTYEQRKIKLTFGDDRGCCLVSLGASMVFCQISAEIEEPKLMRPNEGNLIINLDLSSAASPAFVDKKNTERAVTINRVLEKTIKEARAIDLEALCIISGEKVWTVRVDLQVLNDEGNLLDCACVAAVAGLTHFRRRDVTIDDGKLTLHSIEEREPVPLSVLHYPFTVSISFFKQGEYLLVDPSLLEERVSEGSVMVAMNKHGELCCLQLNGQLIVTQEQIERCIDIAGTIVADLTKLVLGAIEQENEQRRTGGLIGFPVALQSLSDSVLSKVVEDYRSASPVSVDSDKEAVVVQDLPKSTPGSDLEVRVVSPGVIGLGGPSAWEPVAISSSSDEEEKIPGAQRLHGSSNASVLSQADRQEQLVVQVDSDSEEEVVTLTEQQFHKNVNFNVRT